MSTNTILPPDNPSVHRPLDELSLDQQEQLTALRADLARLVVPWLFPHQLEAHLDDREKAVLALFEAISVGLEQSALVFSPRRYWADSFGERRRAESGLWLKVIGAAGLRAPDVEAAFLKHRSEGRAFPRPRDIIELAGGAL